jgi:putative chitinase
LSTYTYEQEKTPMIPVDAQTMREVAPQFSGEAAERQAFIIAAVGEVLAPTLEEYGISTRLRIAHFLGQTCHESAGFRTTEEFATGDAYEGRADLGNTKAGDGRRYKGRGLLQLTGRANYRALGKVLKVDLENDPERAADPALSLRIACEYWKSHKINAACDRDDLIAVTRAINGGTNGLEDRRGYTSSAKAAIIRVEGLMMGGAAPAGARPVLRRGSKGDAVVTLQQALQKLGFMLGVDGDFGAGTEVAVASFQRDQKLKVDGIVGPGTWAALDKAAKPKPSPRAAKRAPVAG